MLTLAMCLLVFVSCDSEPQFAHIEIENYGTIVVELDADEAPITVENFVKLAEEGFYNGLTFHRIIEGFMMQGGCPNGNGTGNSGQTIKGEFSKNGVNNKISHTRGVISMARGGGYPEANYYNTASCQFFIVHEDSEFLDGSYAAFGYVVSGMDIVDKICTEAKPTDSNGSISKSKQPVIKKITILDTAELQPGSETADPNPPKAPEVTEEYNKLSFDNYAHIEIENYGTIVIGLDSTQAPITVENFINLSNSGFYNGLTFHRIMEGFMMQGGCPKGNGTGGNTDADGKEINIKGEFSKNGVNNTISHKRGVISMARAGGYPEANYYNTASSQFFIVHADSEFLDGNYAAFGYVLSGLDIVDRICTESQPTDSNGTIPKAQQPVIKSITISNSK